MLSVSMQEGTKPVFPFPLEMLPLTKLTWTESSLCVGQGIWKDLVTATSQKSSWAWGAWGMCTKGPRGGWEDVPQLCDLGDIFKFLLIWHQKSLSDLHTRY